MAASPILLYTLFLLLICRASAVPVTPTKYPNPICSGAQLVAPGQAPLVYQYKTEVKLSVANGQFDLETEITANVNIKGLGDCNYAVQLRNVKITETKDEDKRVVTSTANAQRELENLVVRFRWVDGVLSGVEADSSAKVDYVNFVKGVLSALQVYSPVVNDDETVVREEDVLGVCTTVYKFSQKDSTTEVKKNKDLSTCSRDKLHLSSSPVLTSVLGPLMEEVFTSRTRYMCRTEIRDKKVQSVKCKTVDMDADDTKTSTQKRTQTWDDNDDHIDTDDSSEEVNANFNVNDRDDEISSKFILIKQELKLLTSGYVPVDENAVKNPVRQTLQFVPTASFDQSNEALSSLVSKIQALLKTEDWSQFAAAQFVDITNQLRRMDKANVEAFAAKSELKDMVPTFLHKLYAHDPTVSLLNLDTKTLKFVNPSAVFYLDKPSTELVNQVVQGASRLTSSQVPEFVGVAARILQTYKARHENVREADAKIKEFQRAIAKFLSNPSDSNTDVTTTVLSAYAQLGLYDDQVQRLAANDKAPLQVQYHALNVIRHISDDYIDKKDELKLRTDLQNLLLRKLQNKANKNAVRVWAFEALYTPFIYNPEEDNSTLADNLEKAFSDILNEPLNQVNGFIWSALKYSSLDRLCPLRGLASRLRAHHDNKQQFLEQQTLSSRQVQIELPLRKNYRAVVHVCVVFENDRVVPSFLDVKLAFDGVRRETLRLPWIDVALISENLDWNFADYFLRLDPLNKKMNEDEKTRVKNNLPAGVKKLQATYDGKDEDPDPSVYFYLKLFGTDMRGSDVTNKVQDMLRTNVRTFVRNQMLNRLKDLVGKNPIFRIPLEIGAASAAANGLTLYKAAQIGILADLTTDLKNNRDDSGLGTYSMTSRSALSFSLTLQREVSGPWTTVGETIEMGVLSSVPFQYTTVANNQGRTRELNLLNPQSKLLAMDFQFAVRTSKGFEVIPNPKSTSIDPSCTPSALYRALGVRLCLELNPFRSLQLGSRPSYPITVTVSKDPSVTKWRMGWRFNAQDAPQFEVVVESVGAKETYPGLGMSVTTNGNNFNVKVLTGMKFFNVKGTQTGNKFSGTVYSSDNKEVMTTSGTWTADSNGLKMEGKLVDMSTNKEVVTLTTDMSPNRGQGLTANIVLTTADKAKSFKVHFRGDLYKPNSKLIHMHGGVHLGDTSYHGKMNFECDDAHTRIELSRSVKLNKNLSPSGYEFFYERKNTKETNQNSSNIVSHLSLRTPTQNEPMKVYNFKSDWTRTNDLSNATLQSSLDYVLLTRNPPVQERVELDYMRRSVRTSNAARRLISPEANLKIQVKTKSNVFNFLVDHRHRRSSETSKKGPVMLPPTLDIANKIHMVADTDKLFPDLPRPFAFDILSDLNFELLNEVNYKFQYDFPRRQYSGLLTYQNKVDKVTHGHLFSGTSKCEVQWDNKQKKATATGNFEICMRSHSLRTHWDITTNLVQDKNDMELDLNVRFDRQPKKNSPDSLITAYNVTLKAPKHQLFQLIDLDGNLTKQWGRFETFNSIAFRMDKQLKEMNLNAFLHRNQTGNGSLQTHVSFSLPFKYIPYVTHDFKVERSSSNGRLSHIESKLLAKPVFAHYGDVDIDYLKGNERPCVHVDNEFEYLRANGDSLYALSKVEVQRWSALHSHGIFRRNTDLLHKHSIGYVFSNKTRKVALSLVSPQISGNPLSIIGEVTIDRENRIGKMKWPQEFVVHFEFGTPLSNVTAFRVAYNLPMFNKDHDRTVDGSIGFKLASKNIAPIGFYVRAKGSLNTTLHVTKKLRIGDDIALNTLITAQYNPQLISQISTTVSSKYYDQEFQHAFHALIKQHQVIVRGILNTTTNKDYRYEMDIGFDNDLLTGHMERTDGQETVISDVDAQKCGPIGKYNRCYKGDITVRTGTSTSGNKGTFDISWGRDMAKLNVKVPNHIELKFDHTHTGRIRDEDFNSKTNFEGKLLQSDKRGSFSYSGSVEKEDGRWNDVQMQTSLTDMKTGEKSLATNVRLNQKITDKLSGKFQRNMNINLERKGNPVIVWSSESVSCPNNPSNVVYGVCQTATFNMKASNQLAQRLRERLQLPADPQLSNPTGQVTYDGTLNLDLKHDPTLGPHTMKFDLNRLKNDAVDMDLTYQPRTNDKPMNMNLKLNLPRQNPITVKYDETIRSKTSFNGVLKYSLNANDNSAEKTYQCDVNRPDMNAISMNCVGQRTTLTVDIDRNMGKSKVYMDLKRFAGERVGYEVVWNRQTREFNGTLYTLVSSWNVRRQPGKSTVVTVKQKDQEVLRVEATRMNDREIQIKFLPSNAQFKLVYDNTTIVTLTQTAPQQRDVAMMTIDRARIRRYLPSLRNQDRPSYDIDAPLLTSHRPLFEISFDSFVLLSLSQAVRKLGSHNGRYGLDTIKKVYKLQVGDAPLTVYNVQHWKTHREDIELPESYFLRVVNNVNGNMIQFATNRWNENRLVSTISHSFDGGKTLTTDMKLERDYGHQVGSLYFFYSLGYRNVQGVKQLRNVTRHFIREHLTKDLQKTNMAELVKNFRTRVRSILEKDYAAVKEIVTTWGSEPENSFLRRLSTRLGLPDFFTKYPTYTEASDRISAVLRERSVQREEFWRNRFEVILNDNRLLDLSKRVQVRRMAIMKSMLERTEKLLDRYFPKVDQSKIDERIANYVRKILAGVEQMSKRNTEKWKSIFKAIDDASKGDDNKWFRTLVADIDSNAMGAAADAELAKLLKKVGDSSKLWISSIQQMSRRMTKRSEAMRERIRNAIRHMPKASINETNFEVLVPIGNQPASYTGTNELIYGIGSLLRNRDQALDTIRSVLMNRVQSRSETWRNYWKALRTLARRLFQRNPSLTPEFYAVIAHTGDAIDFHGDYVYLNPACDYVLAHDFGGLQFSFRFASGKVYSVVPNQVEIKEYECSNTGRVQLCNQGYYSTISVPMYYGGLVDGALGDVRDRSGTGHGDLSRWSVQNCPATTRDQSKDGGSSIPECASDDDEEQQFCENFVQRGVKNGLDRRLLVIQAMAARKYTV
ncbi:unnamed protein product [Rotaria sordida]|uniref:Vitellogenin domain-containing protein n=1 Tax=Rotaria sordida TaxID=392033 RepID=A0A814CF76_9BILA|nr:unnamed protein product [Rotaria sordida]